MSYREMIGKMYKNHVVKFKHLNSCLPLFNFQKNSGNISKVLNKTNYKIKHSLNQKLEI